MSTASHPHVSGGTVKRIIGAIALAAGVVVPTAILATASSAGSATTVQMDRLPASTTDGLSLIVEPGQQIGPIDAVLTSPKHSLDMTMYELVDPVAEKDLVTDAARGVKVRVVLDRNREQDANTPAYKYLGAHGVQVHWAPASYEATHEKAAIVDAGYPDKLALVMTLNLTSRYYATTRDFAVVDHAPADVAAIESVFKADFAGKQSTPTPPGLDLVWSPGSEKALLNLIGSARHSLAVENEEMSNADVVTALAVAAAGGVVTHVTMTYDSGYRSEFSKLAAFGVGVHLYPDTSSALYIHAKVIVVDAGTATEKAFVGSENFSTASMEDNRELGIIITNHAIVDELAKGRGQDYRGALPTATVSARPPAATTSTPPPPGTTSTTPPPATTPPTSSVTTTTSSSGQPSNTSPSGRYYKPGEYCPKADLGETITDPYGTMTCEVPSGGGQPVWTLT